MILLKPCDPKILLHAEPFKLKAAQKWAAFFYSGNNLNINRN